MTLRAQATLLGAAPPALLAIVLVALIPSYLKPILIAGGVAVILGALLGAFYGWRVFTPIEKLRERIEIKASKQSPTAQLPENAPGEIGTLITSFRQLSAQIESLETTRRDFVANVSHELRTPLTIIGGFAETLVDDDIDPATRQQFIGSILNNTQRMQRIVDDLLDLARIESGHWTPQPTTIDLNNLLKETVSSVEIPANLKHLHVSFQPFPDGFTIYSDRTALRQILGNLVENAVRHTPANGTIKLDTSVESGFVHIDVIDTGPGIPQDHLNRIFERFYRIDSARTREGGGTGLGLAIVKHLAEAHGGTVQAKSKLGVGTTMRIQLPIVAVKPAGTRSLQERS